MRRPGVHLRRSRKSAALRKSAAVTPFAMRPPKYACRPSMSSTSSASEAMISLLAGSRPRALQPRDVFVPGDIGILAVDALAGPIGRPVRRAFQKLRGAEGVGQHDAQLAVVGSAATSRARDTAKPSAIRHPGASAASTMGISCALVPIASRSCLWARNAFEVPVKSLPRFAAMASTTYSCHRKL